MHDKDRNDSSERVANTATYNLHTNNIDRAARYMAWTDFNRETIKEENGGSAAGAKAEAGNVYHYSLSWKVGEQVEWDHMQETAVSSISRLGLQEHQFYLVEHTDTDHPHVHVVVNLAHPETGKIANVYRDHKRLDRWANEYEQEYGIVCENRAQKYEQWDRKKRAFDNKKEREECEAITSKAFQHSDSGKAFQAALEQEGLSLARGRRRGLVVVSRSGEIYGLTRLIDFDDGTTGRAKTKVINDRLKDLDRAGLGDAEELAADRRSFDRDAYEVSRQKSLSEAAEKAAQERAEQEDRARLTELVANRKAAAAKVERWREIAIKREIERKTTLSRRRWEIDDLTKQRDQAKTELEKLNTFWARVFRRKAIAEAKWRVESMQKTLDERMGRHRADIEAFNRSVRENPPKIVEQGTEMTPEERRLATKQAFLDRMAEERKRSQGRSPERRDFDRE